MNGAPNETVRAKVLDCGFNVSGFELQSPDYVSFRINILGKV